MIFAALAWPRCALCTKPCHPARRFTLAGSTYCCRDCAFPTSASVSWVATVATVLERDQGRCARCPLDALALREELDGILADLQKLEETPRAWASRDLPAWKGRLAGLVKVGFDEDAIRSGDRLWECAHVVARSQGGSDRPDNCVTLCLGCHKDDTTRLAGERAALRREALGHVPYGSKRKIPSRALGAGRALRG